MKMIRIVFVIMIVKLSSCDDDLKSISDTVKISSRDYPSGSGSSNYYTTYPGYPTSSGSYLDSFKPSEYSGYYNNAPDNKKKPSYPTYPTFYPSASAPVPPECQDQMMTNVIGDILQTGGVAKYGLLRSIIAAITAGVLAKIPIILAVKALLVKLILVPIGFIVLSLPIILPIMLLFYPLWTKLKETFIGPSATPQPVLVMMAPHNVTNTTSETKGKSLDGGGGGRDLFIAIMESERCFEKFACQLGARDANSPFIKPVSWLLKFLQTFKFVQKNIEVRSILKRYRESYLQGVTLSKQTYKSNSTNVNEEICQEATYPCNMPLLYSRPEYANYSRYL